MLKNERKVLLEYKKLLKILKEQEDDDYDEDEDEEYHDPHYARKVDDYERTHVIASDYDFKAGDTVRIIKGQYKDFIVKIKNMQRIRGAMSYYVEGDRFTTWKKADEVDGYEQDGIKEIQEINKLRHEVATLKYNLEAEKKYSATVHKYDGNDKSVISLEERAELHKLKQENEELKSKIEELGEKLPGQKKVKNWQSLEIDE